MVVEAPSTPRLLMSVHISTVMRFPVGRVCTNKPLELQLAFPEAAGGLFPSAASAVTTPAAASACTSASIGPGAVMSAAPPAIAAVVQSAGVGCKSKLFV